MQMKELSMGIFIFQIFQVLRLFRGSRTTSTPRPKVARWLHSVEWVNFEINVTPFIVHIINTVSSSIKQTTLWNPEPTPLSSPTPRLQDARSEFPLCYTHNTRSRENPTKFRDTFLSSNEKKSSAAARRSRSSSSYFFALACEKIFSIGVSKVFFFLFALGERRGNAKLFETLRFIVFPYFTQKSIYTFWFTDKIITRRKIRATWRSRGWNYIQKSLFPFPRCGGTKPASQNRRVSEKQSVSTISS